MADFFSLETLETIAFVISAVVFFTLLYKMLPFKVWTPHKPSLTWFPKYKAQFNRSIPEIKASLKALKFTKNANGTYSRGKIYGDFSANAIKLTAKIDSENKELMLYASFFGVVFDRGDLWTVTHDIIEGRKH